MASNEKKKEGGQDCGSVQKCLPGSGPSSAQAECCKRMRANSHTRPTFMETIFLGKKISRKSFFIQSFCDKEILHCQEIPFFNLFSFYVLKCFACRCVCVSHAYLGPKEAEEFVRCPGTAVIGVWGPPCGSGCSVLDLGFLEERPVLFTTEPSVLQPYKKYVTSP